MSYNTVSYQKWLTFGRSGINFSNRAKPVIPLDKYERWRRVAKILKLSKAARHKLEWIIYHHQGHSVSLTARHFGISRKTFYKWFNQFDQDNIYTLYNLEEKNRAPKHVRQREITRQEESRIIELRKKYVCYGKIKLAKIYFNTYGEEISSWKVQKVIEDKKLYRNKAKNAKIQRKRRKAVKKKRITELKLHKLPWYKKKAGYIICLDTIVIYSMGVKRYIFTAVDKYGKVAFARMYKSKATVNSKDFLTRLYYLLDGNVCRVTHHEVAQR